MKDARNTFKDLDKIYPHLELPKWMREPKFLEEELDL